MEQSKIEKIRDHILEEIEEIKSSIISIKETVKPIAPDQSLGRLTRMDAIGMKSINEAALRNAENSLARFKKGLTMIEKESFGICTKCNSEIPIERLMIMPGSEICVPCIQKFNSK